MAKREIQTMKPAQQRRKNMTIKEIITATPAEMSRYCQLFLTSLMKLPSDPWLIAEENAVVAEAKAVENMLGLGMQTRSKVRVVS